jgi:hypothetical protein
LAPRLAIDRRHKLKQTVEVARAEFGVNATARGAAAPTAYKEVL